MKTNTNVIFVIKKTDVELLVRKLDNAMCFGS